MGCARLLDLDCHVIFDQHLLRSALVDLLQHNATADRSPDFESRGKILVCMVMAIDRGAVPFASGARSLRNSSLSVIIEPLGCQPS